MPRKKLIQLRRDTAAGWAAANTVLAAGEPGVVTDLDLLFIGDGVTTYNQFVAAGAVSSLGSNPDLLTVGWTVPLDRRYAFGAANTGSLLASQVLNLHYFTAPRTETLATMTTYTGSTAAAATPSLCRYGIYSIAANGAGTLVASTPNDTAIWAATNTAYPKAFSVPFAFQAAQRYAAAVLCVSAAAIPVLVTPVFAALSLVDVVVGAAPRIAAFLGSQADLPSSFTNASLSNSRIQFTTRLS